MIKVSKEKFITLNKRLDILFEISSKLQMIEISFLGEWSYHSNSPINKGRTIALKQIEEAWDFFNNFFWVDDKLFHEEYLKLFRDLFLTSSLLNIFSEDTTIEKLKKLIKKREKNEILFFSRSTIFPKNPILFWITSSKESETLNFFEPKNLCHHLNVIINNLIILEQKTIKNIEIGLFGWKSFISKNLNKTNALIPMPYNVSNIEKKLDFLFLKLGI